MSLCQPGGGASCGACCGLYNFADHSREALTAALARRTAALRTTARTVDAFRATGRSVRAAEAQALFTDVRICPLLGFLDADHTRVGCLAHPLVNEGQDLRDCGVYDARTCQTFECPSHVWLDAWQAELVRDACADWYLYGLVITDVEFVRGCLRLVEDVLCRPVPRGRLNEPTVRAAFSALFRLKETASGRADGAPIFGRFAPDGTGDASLRTLDYAALGVAPAAEDDVVLCLGHAPGDAAALHRARAEVREAVLRTARAFS